MGSRHAGYLALVLALMALAVPAVAGAADPAAATITACNGDSLTIAGKVAPSGGAARKARGGVLQMRFQAFSLFGLPVSAPWRSFGKKLRATSQQNFSGLGAGEWIGVLSWRYRRGSRTVVSDYVRSQPLRIGRSRGHADCTLAIGAKPLDKTAPTLAIQPADGNWHHAPTAVRLLAQDDFSGVAHVQYSLDGGPLTSITNGGSFTIGTEGAHTVTSSATDVDGNTSTRTDVVKVDAAPPTKPVVTSPPAGTSNTTPTISWTASTDSGSGIRGYFVSVRRGDGATVVSQPVDANTTSVQAPPLDNGQTYTVTITAVDNTADQAWTTNSDPYTFKISPTVTKVDPPSRTVLAGNLKSGTFTLALDSAADPSTVAGSVALHRNPESGSDPTGIASACANNPCTTITVHPSAALPEGLYTLSESGLKTTGGQLFEPFKAVYSVPFLEAPSGPSNPLCNSAASTATTPVPATSAETGTLAFDWSYPSGPGWKVEAIAGSSTVLGSMQSTSTGSGHASLTYTIPAAQNSITFKFTDMCSGLSPQLKTSNLVAARVP